MFRDRTTAALCAATLAAMVAVEATDMRTERGESDRVDDQGTSALFAGAMAAAIGVGATSMFRPGRRTIPRHPRLFGAGLSTIWTGLALNRWARRTLGRNYRPRVTVVDDHEVVTGGPYRVVRHPMYLGASLTCVGVAATLGTPAAAVAWLLPPAALVRRILVEERVLSQSLGGDYERFSACRWRLVPGIW